MKLWQIMIVQRRRKRMENELLAGGPERPENVLDS